MGIMNKALIGMDVINGVGKSKNTFKDSANNKYDNVMNTSTPQLMQPKPKTIQASEFIDEMFLEKTAINKQDFVKYKNVIQKHIKDIPKKVDRLDRFNNIEIKKMKRAVKNKKIGKALKHGARAGAITIPAVAGMAGTAIGAGKAVKHFEDKKPIEERSDLFPKAVSAGVGGALAFNSITNRSALHPLKMSSKLVKGALSKIPRNAVKRSGKVGNAAVNVYDNSKDKINKFFSAMDKEKKKAAAEASAEMRYKRAKAKKAKNKGGIPKTSSEIDIMYELEKNAKYDFAKKVFKENFLRAGVESIPYNLAPAVASVALGRDLKRGGTKIEPSSTDVKTTIIDIPSEQLQDITKKQATVNENTKRFIERSAEGLGRAVFPAATSAFLGKNIMNNMENLKDKNNKLNTLSSPKEGMTRIIIQQDDKKKTL